MEKIDTTSAKKTSDTTKKNDTKDGISSLMQTIISGLGDPNSQGNAGTIYNIIKLLA